MTDYETLVQRAVQTVVDFNIEMGEDQPDDEEVQFCEELTHRVFDAIGLRRFLAALQQVKSFAAENAPPAGDGSVANEEPWLTFWTIANNALPVLVAKGSDA